MGRRPTARVLYTPDRARQERVATSFSPLDVDACLYTYANTFEMSEFSCTAGRATAFSENRLRADRRFAVLRFTERDKKLGAD